MLINQAALTAAATGYRAITMAALRGVETYYGEVCNDFPTSGPVEIFDYTEALGSMREWVGERQINNLKVHEQTVKVVEYERTVGVKRTHFEDDRLGVYNPRFIGLGQAAALHPDELLVDLLNGAFANKTWDGKNFCATNHGSGSNKVSGALSATTFNTAIKQFRNQKTMDGKSQLRVLSMGGELELVVAANLEATARGILLAQNNSNGSSNTDYGRASLRVLEGLSDGFWFLVVKQGALRPFMRVLRQAPMFESLTDGNGSDRVFLQGEFLFGVRARYAMTYALHQLIQGSNGS